MYNVKTNLKGSLHTKIGKIVTQLITGVVFFFVITPIAIVIKLLKKDILNLKFNNKKSYWIKKSEIKIKMKNQF